MFLLIYLILFVLGVAVGSFLNVLIDRLPRGEPLRGRSRCDSCRTPLPWYDLVPILSFLWLRGKCRYCGARIPRRLLVVEVLTGIGFVFLCWWIWDTKYQILDTGYWILFATYCLVLFSVFVALFFTDLEYGVLPDKIVVPAIGVALAWRVVPLVLNTKYQILDTKYWILPAFGLSLFFLLLIAVTCGRGMGFGDVKLGFLVGLVLGWPKILVAAFLAFLFGGMVSVILLISGKKRFGETIPFGPFLIAGMGAAAVWGDAIWEWYLGML